MIDFNLLKNADASLETVQVNSEIAECWTTISDFKRPLSNSLMFIKNKYFLEEWFLLSSSTDKLEKIHLVIDKKFYASLAEDARSKIFRQEVQMISTVESVDMAISYFSKVVHELTPTKNDFVDGRIMMTVDIHPNATIAQNVFLGEGVSIASGVKIHSGVVIHSGVKIDEEVEIFPNVVVYKNVKIGARTRIHAGSVIGSDGFGYNHHRGIHHKVYHFGSVEIGADVEIGSNVSVDQGTFSPTIIGDGTKIDNLVQVGHNVRVGKGVLLCGNVALAGSSELGDYVVVGGHSAVSNGIKVGSATQVAAMSGVTHHVEAKQVVGGFPARDIKEWMRSMATLRKLALKNTSGKKEENEN